MNIKDGSVCRGAVANELGDRPGLARAPPPPAARDLAASRTPVSPRRGQQGAVRPRGASLAPGAQLPGLGSPCSQCRPPSAPSLGAGRGGDPASAYEGGVGWRLQAWIWLFKLLNDARGARSSSLRYLSYKYRRERLSALFKTLLNSSQAFWNHLMANPWTWWVQGGRVGSWRLLPSLWAGCSCFFRFTPCLFSS